MWLMAYHIVGGFSVPDATPVEIPLADQSDGKGRPGKCDLTFTNVAGSMWLGHDDPTLTTAGMAVVEGLVITLEHNETMFAAASGGAASCNLFVTRHGNVPRV